MLLHQEAGIGPEKPWKIVGEQLGSPMWKGRLNKLAEWWLRSNMIPLQISEGCKHPVGRSHTVEQNKLKTWQKQAFLLHYGNRTTKENCIRRKPTSLVSATIYDDLTRISVSTTTLILEASWNNHCTKLRLLFLVDNQEPCWTLKIFGEWAHVCSSEVVLNRAIFYKTVKTWRILINRIIFDPIY